MSITDELRAGGIYRFPSNRRVFTEEQLTAIADRIDAEHERVLRERRRSCVYYDPERHYCSCHDFDVSGYVELPKDADGVPIHIGDEVTEHEDGYTFKVDGFMCWDGEWWVFQRDAIQAPTRRCTHYHAPTVEDVLREFAERYLDYEGVPSAGRRGIGDALMDEYAQRLQLRGVDA